MTDFANPPRTAPFPKQFALWGPKTRSKVVQALWNGVYSSKAGKELGGLKFRAEANGLDAQKVLRAYNDWSSGHDPKWLTPSQRSVLMTAARRSRIDLSPPRRHKTPRPSGNGDGWVSGPPRPRPKQATSTGFGLAILLIVGGGATWLTAGSFGYLPQLNLQTYFGLILATLLVVVAEVLELVVQTLRLEVNAG